VAARPSLRPTAAPGDNQLIKYLPRNFRWNFTAFVSNRIERTMTGDKYAFSDLRVLIVDNNSHARANARALLAAFGVRDMLEAPGGAEGIKALGKFQPNLLICEHEMQPMDGIAFVRAVRLDEASPNPYAPIIVTVGSCDRQTVLTLRDAGTTEIISRPLTAQNLFLKIAEIVERPREFVRCRDYFGPDRRRRRGDGYSGPLRRREDRESVVAI
jgi:two-component system, chemotaxis family, chemotaxis protein CheY